MMKLFAYALREFDEKEFFDKFSAELGCEYGYTTAYPNPQNVELARGYDAISATPCDLSMDMLDRLHEVGVKYIATRSIGVDHIDLIHAEELGMGVCNTTYPPETVADYAVMLMLMCCRNICHILDRARIQDFTLQGKMGRDISDCTVGVIGCGNIGKTVIRRLSAFGCRILANDIRPNEEIAQLAEYVPLNTIYEHSDIITLHAPATLQNYHLLNSFAFSRMKQGVIIINTARGSLIDTKDLILSIESGRIGHAALDVLEDENGLYYANRMGDPIENRNMAILRSFPNVILSPHTAFYTSKVVQNMAYKCMKGVLDMMDGNDNPNIILRPGQKTVE